MKTIDFKNTLFNYDCLKLMKNMEDSSVDLVIADPPYFQIYGDFDFGVFKDRQSYLDWCLSWLIEARRILKDTGTLILWGGLGEREINIA